MLMKYSLKNKLLLSEIINIFNKQRILNQQKIREY